MTPLSPAELAWLTRAASHMATHGNARDERIGQLVLRLIRAGRAMETRETREPEREAHWRNGR